MAAGVIFLERARKLRVTESRTWPCRLLSCCPCLCLLLQPLMFLIDWFDQKDPGKRRAGKGSCQDLGTNTDKGCSNQHHRNLCSVLTAASLALQSKGSYLGTVVKSQQELGWVDVQSQSLLLVVPHLFLGLSLRRASGEHREACS